MAGEETRLPPEEGSGVGRAVRVVVWVGVRVVVWGGSEGSGVGRE